MIETTPEQRMKLCPDCLSEKGSYTELDQKLHEQFGLHHTYLPEYKTHKTWRTKEDVKKFGK